MGSVAPPCHREAEPQGHAMEGQPTRGYNCSCYIETLDIIYAHTAHFAGYQGVQNEKETRSCPLFREVFSISVY